MNIVPFGCAFGHVGHFQKLLVWTIAPTVMIAVVVISIRVVKEAGTKVQVRMLLIVRFASICIHDPVHLRANATRNIKSILFFKQLRKGACFVLIMMLPLISRTTLQTFRCVKYNEEDDFTNIKISNQ